MQLSKLRSLTLVTLLVTLTISLSACGNSNPEIKNHNTATSSIIKLLKSSKAPITPKVYSSTNDQISSDYFNYPEEKCYTQSNPSLCLTSLLENTVTTKGAQTITLLASGKPTVVGSFNYNVTSGTSTCAKTVTFSHK